MLFIFLKKLAWQVFAFHVKTNCWSNISYAICVPTIKSIFKSYCWDTSYYAQSRNSNTIKETVIIIFTRVCGEIICIILPFGGFSYH